MRVAASGVISWTAPAPELTLPTLSNQQCWVLVLLLLAALAMRLRSVGQVVVEEEGSACHASLRCLFPLRLG